MEEVWRQCDFSYYKNKLEVSNFGNVKINGKITEKIPINYSCHNLLHPTCSSKPGKYNSLQLKNVKISTDMNSRNYIKIRNSYFQIDCWIASAFGKTKSYRASPYHLNKNNLDDNIENLIAYEDTQEYKERKEKYEREEKKRQEEREAKARFKEIIVGHGFDKFSGSYSIIKKICKACGAESLEKNGDLYHYTGLIEELHNKEECHLCRDWNGCKTDCTHSGTICLKCGNKEGY